MRGAIITAVAVMLAALPARGLPGPGSANRATVQELRLRGSTRQVFRQIERNFGRKIVVDSGLRTRRFQFRLQDADFETTLKVLTTLTGSFWVELPDGSVLILADTDANRREHMPQALQSFPLPGYTQEEINEVVQLLQQQVEPPHLAVDLRTSTLTIRDTPRRLAVIAALLEQWAPRREDVVLDALVLEVDRDEARRLGILPPDLAVLVHVGAGVLPTDDPLEFLRVLRELVNQGVLPAVLLTDRFDFTRGVGLVGIGGGRTAYVANLPNVSLTLADLDRVILSLRRMRLRTSTGTEATFFAGERFPVAFATFSIIFIPQIIQDLIDEERFVPPVPAIRYEEIGLKLTAAARVHNNREISLAVTLESTQLAGEGINGIPIIGTRRLEQKVRLKEGESVVLSGMRGLERTRGRAGWPLLGAIPVLGRLFSRTENRTRETEFLVLLTPHLVRGGERDARTQQALYLGTEKEFAPVGRAQAGRRAPRARPRPRGAPRQPLRPQPEQQPQQPRQNPQPRQQQPNRNQ